MVYLMGIVSGLMVVIFSIYKMTKESGKFRFQRDLKQNQVMNNIKRFIRLKFSQSVDLSKKERIIILAIAILMVSTTNQVANIPRYLFWGVILGLVFVKSVSVMQQKAEKTKKIKEITTLFEAVELYTKAGYNVYQSLRAARVLTHKIRPSLDRCLEYWGNSPQKALELLQKELQLAESEILILLLTHMEVVGTKEMQGVMKRETNNINRLKTMKNQVSISNRPLMLMVYRMLPLVSIIGITVGSLLYRTYSVLSESGIL